MNVASFYRFLEIPAAADLRDRLYAICEGENLLGTVLLAAEGFNGSLAGKREGILRTLRWLEEALALAAPVVPRWSEASEAPFRRLHVRLKKEIVTLGRPDIRPDIRTGHYVDPERWNTLLEDPDVLVIDTRNRYEIEVGTFPSAVDPGTRSFREFQEFARELADENRDRPLAMFCTGGIRCEKATALMLEMGFEEVYHLEGGILRYLEETDPKENKYVGECFVFDTRVAIDQDLGEAGYVQCHACRRPLSAADLATAEYREGISCPHCIDELDAERAVRLEERRKQVRLAAKRGEAHIGPRDQAAMRRRS